MDPTTAIIIVALLTIPLHIGVAWFFHRNSSDTAVRHEVLKERLENMNKKLERNSEKMRETVEGQFKDSRSLIKEITKEVEAVKKTNENVLDITESLEDLERVLKNQKERGALGEAGLSLILENLLPPNAFSLQYKFEDGDLVDAVIKAKDGIIPVDAKFPLSNYQRLIEVDDKDKKEKLEQKFKTDLKGRIDETSKYIRPEEDTLPFALMYVPAEGVYYDLLVNKVGSSGANPRNLIEYAHEKSVIIVSPTTLAAYLHTILQGLRAFRVEKNAERIQEGIDELRKHLRSYEDAHKGLGKHLNTVVNKYDKSSRKLRGIGRDIRQITDGDFDLDGVEAENPQLRDDG